jgi:antitoxin ParD1/3/4
VAFEGRVIANEAKTLELPDNVRTYVEDLLESGRFESPEAVISMAVENMRREDTRIEQWLRDEVMPTYHAMKAGLSRVILADEVFAESRLALRRADKETHAAARQDLNDIFNWVADARGEDGAIRYIARIRTYMGFEFGAQRGTRRQHLAPDLRIAGFVQRLNITFVVEVTTVYILRVFTARQNWVNQLKAEDSE